MIRICVLLFAVITDDLVTKQCATRDARREALLCIGFHNDHDDMRGNDGRVEVASKG